MPSKMKVKVFKRPASALDTLETEIASWLNTITASHYIIQSMAQNAYVETTYAAAYEDWVDEVYVVVTFMATYIPPTS